MGIQIEFNPDLALRKFKTEGKEPEECIPENIKEGEAYQFLKKGKRLYWLHGEIPLRITIGNQQLSKPLASVIILEEVHFLRDNEIWTKGKYKVVKLLNENELYFDGYEIRKEAKNKKMGIGVGIMVLNENGEVLLGKRNDDKSKAGSELSGEGTWTMPGGKLEFGEDFETGAVREVKEETGIDVKKLKVICVNNDKTENAHFVTIGLQAEEYEGNPLAMEPEEITEWRWFNLNELPAKVFTPSSEIVENYKQNKFYITK